MKWDGKSAENRVNSRCKAPVCGPGPPRTACESRLVENVQGGLGGQEVRDAARVQVEMVGETMKGQDKSCPQDSPKGQQGKSPAPWLRSSRKLSHRSEPLFQPQAAGPHANLTWEGGRVCMTLGCILTNGQSTWASISAIHFTEHDGNTSNQIEGTTPQLQIFCVSHSLRSGPLPPLRALSCLNRLPISPLHKGSSSRRWVRNGISSPSVKLTHYGRNSRLRYSSLGRIYNGRSKREWLLCHLI